MRPPRAAPLALLLAGTAACGGRAEAPAPAAAPAPPARPRAVAVVPEDADGEFLWLQALDRSDVGDPVAPGIEGALSEELSLGLEDLYLELWYDGGAPARRLLDLVRDCDASALIRFGPPLVVARSELDPPSAAPIELRYLAIDPRGRAAAELLRHHLQAACAGAAGDELRAILAEHGLALRPVAAFPDFPDAENRSPLVLLAQPPPPPAGPTSEL